MDRMNKQERARLVAMISRAEMDFLDKIGKDAMFSTGKKLSHTDVISAIIDAVASLEANGRNIHSKQELRERFLSAMSKRHERFKMDNQKTDNNVRTVKKNGGAK